MSTLGIWGRNTIEELESGMSGHPNSSRLSLTHAEHPRLLIQVLSVDGRMPGCGRSSSVVQGKSSAVERLVVLTQSPAFAWELLALFRVGWRGKSRRLHPLLQDLRVLLLLSPTPIPEPRAHAGGCQDRRAKALTAPLPAERHCLHCKHKPSLGWTCCGSASIDVALERRSCTAALGWKS